MIPTAPYKPVKASILYLYNSLMAPHLPCASTLLGFAQITS